MIPRHVLGSFVPYQIAAIALAATVLSSCQAAPAPTPTAPPPKPAATSAPVSLPAATTKPSATAAPAVSRWEPTKDFTFIVPFAAGGSTDIGSRMAAQGAEPILGRRLMIQNSGGAAGIKGTTEILQSRPDGYTIGLVTDNIISFQPLVAETSWKSSKDLQPIAKLSDQRAVLLVRADAPWKTLNEFVAAAKQKPEGLRVAVAGKLASTDLARAQLDLRAGMQTASVTFNSAGETIPAVLGGHVEAVVAYPQDAISQTKAGAMRALAVFQETRNPLLPDVPSTVELGYKATMGVGYYVVGPKGLQSAVVDRLNQVYGEAVKSPQFQKYAQDNGLMVKPLTPAQIAQEFDDYSKAYTELAAALKVGRK